MDTDDLSKPTYNGIILECEKYNHDLTLQFGILASTANLPNNVVGILRYDCGSFFLIFSGILSSGILLFESV